MLLTWPPDRHKPKGVVLIEGIAGVVVGGEASRVLEEYWPTVGAPFGVQGSTVEDDAVYLVDVGGAFCLVVDLSEGEGFTSVGLGPLVVGESFFHLYFKVLPDEVV